MYLFGHGAYIRRGRKKSGRKRGKMENGKKEKHAKVEMKYSMGRVVKFYEKRRNFFSRGRGVNYVHIGPFLKTE
jgi:hypothetical protein